MFVDPSKLEASAKAKQSLTRFNPGANLIAGGFGGLCSLVVGYPFDTVKVRLQTSSQYKSAVDCFFKTVKHEGFFSLFRYHERFS